MQPKQPLANTDTKIYHMLTLIFIFCLLISNIAEMKITSFLGVAQIGAGTLFFPMLYVMNDVITEVYGFSASRRTIWLALICNLSFSLLMYGIIHLPDGEDWQEKEAFETIFTLSPRIMIGSLSSYFLGELINSTIMSLLKFKLKGRMFAARAIFSTFVAAFMESIIFGLIAFYGRIPDDELVKMTITLALIKVVYEICVMPITTWLVVLLKNKEQLDVYEQPSLRKVLPSW
jgi:uncharacterized integral membrane protein (TIGR00697 family)